MLRVEEETLVTVNFRVVVVRAVKVTMVAVPSLASAGTGTVVPSEKVSVAPVTWSLLFGRS
jgi:hypothetical protein